MSEIETDRERQGEAGREGPGKHWTFSDSL